MKLIRDPRGGVVELYDFSSDPGELVNLADDRPEEAQRRSSVLGGFIRAHGVKRWGYKTPYRP